MAEGSFLEVYQKLYEAPDPAQALQAALVSSHLLPGSRHGLMLPACQAAQPRLSQRGVSLMAYFAESWPAGQSPAWQYCQHENRGVT